MAATRTPRESWIEQGLHALAAGGPNAVRVEPLAQSLGVTKGGFYWQFGDRRALLEAMLETWERLVVDEAIAAVEGRGGDARERLWRLFSLAGDYFQDDALDIELAIRDWARREPAVAARLRRIDNRRMEYLRRLFGELCPDGRDAEARCLLTMGLFVGQHFIAAEHGELSRRQVMRAALSRLLD